MEPFITLANQAYDAADDDLTALTGGNSETVGYTGADFLWTINTFPTGVQKRAGNTQITVGIFNDSGATPIAATGNFVHTLTCEAFDKLGVDTSGSTLAGMGVTMASNQIDAGLYYTLPVDQLTREFWWLGSLRHGTYTVTATFNSTVTDRLGAAVGPQQITLPIGSVNFTEVDARFSCRYCGNNTAAGAVTLDVRIRRTAVGPNANGRLGSIAAALLVPTPPPMPGGGRKWLAYSGLYGGANA